MTEELEGWRRGVRRRDEGREMPRRTKVVDLMERVEWGVEQLTRKEGWPQPGVEPKGKECGGDPNGGQGSPPLEEGGGGEQAGRGRPSAASAAAAKEKMAAMRHRRRGGGGRGGGGGMTGSHSEGRERERGNVVGSTNSVLSGEKERRKQRTEANGVT